MKYIIVTIFALCMLGGIGSIAVFAQAADPISGFDQTAGSAFKGTNIVNTNSSLPNIVGGIIGTALSFLGIIFLVLTIYGGFMWMTAGGNSEKVGKATELITQAGVGLAIVMAAYLITRYLGEAIINILS